MKRISICGIVAGAVVGLAAAVSFCQGFYGLYKSSTQRPLDPNYSEAAVSIETGAHTRHYVGLSDHKSLKLMLGEPLDIGYSVADGHGLESITLKVNGNAIYQGAPFESSPNEESGVFTEHFLSQQPGQYTVELTTTDRIGNEKTDRAQVTVTHKKFNKK